MKLKSILCLAAALSVSGQVLAMEIYKGKVISQKVWSTHGGKARIAPSKRLQNHHMRSPNNTYEYSYANIYSETAKVNLPTIISNSNAVNIDNNSDTTHKYMIGQSACSETPEATVHCVHYFEEVELEAGGYLNENMQPVLEMTYTKPGNYRITTITSYGELTGPMNYNKATGVMTVS